MIYYFTALVFHYAIGDNLVSAAVWYENEQHCQEAMDQRYADPLYNQLYELYGSDIMVSCEVSDVVSYRVRPKLRPEEESDG